MPTGGFTEASSRRPATNTCSRASTRSGTGGFPFRVFATIEHAGLDASLHEHADLVASMRSDHPREAGEAMIAHIRQGLSLQLRGLAE